MPTQALRRAEQDYRREVGYRDRQELLDRIKRMTAEGMSAREPVSEVFGWLP